MMGEREKSLPLSEPMIIPCVFAELVMIEMRDEVVRLVGVVDLEKTEHAGQERRIVLRAALPRTTARALAADLRRLLRQGQH